MRDPRINKLAEVLVNYSTAVQPGDLVLIRGGPIGLPLVTAVYDEVLRAGGHAHIAMTPRRVCREFVATGNGHATGVREPNLSVLPLKPWT